MNEVFSDKLKEECGIFGVFGHAQAAHLTELGLFALQHRGQEAAGIVSTDGMELYQLRGIGLVSEVFNENNIKNLPGAAAIGHTRYSTAGANTIR